MIRGGDVAAIEQHARSVGPAKLKSAARLAVKLGNAPAAKALVLAGAKPDAEWLYDAIRKDDAQMTAAALATGLSPTVAVGYGDAPVIFAINRGKPRSLAVMLDHGVPVNWSAYGHPSLLHTAIRRERVNGRENTFTDAYVRSLGLEVDTHDGSSVVDLLIERGADLNCLDESGYSLLTIATAELGEDSDRVAVLRRLGASEAGLVALQLVRAISANDRPKVDALLDATPPPPAAELNLPLGFAVGRGDRQLIQRLLDRGADLNSGYAAVVCRAVCSSQIPADERLELVKWLLNQGADPEQPNRHGHTALECAQADALHDIEQVLREAGATLPRRRDLARARGCEEPGGSESSLCVLGPAAEVAEAIAAAIGGKVIRDVYRTSVRPSAPAVVVVQLRGHRWSHLFPMFSSYCLPQELGARLSHDVLHYAYQKNAEAYSYTLWRSGVIIESYLHYDDDVKFSSALGTDPPSKRANPVRVIDRAFKRLDGWAIDTGLTAWPQGAAAVTVDLVGVDSKDVAGAHLVEALALAGGGADAGESGLS